ncbi:hypothetical protein GY45DRAFT_215218 [Cubamyces sp. BRFM 1775]|nr:hypothetical protein GY45DRAFT_215218 [Cubamyces sp. BRFM 1775]
MVAEPFRNGWVLSARERRFFAKAELRMASTELRLHTRGVVRIDDLRVARRCPRRLARGRDDRVAPRRCLYVVDAAPTPGAMDMTSGSMNSGDCGAPCSSSPNAGELTVKVDAHVRRLARESDWLRSSLIERGALSMSKRKPGLLQGILRNSPFSVSGSQYLVTCCTYHALAPGLCN